MLFCCTAPTQLVLTSLIPFFPAAAMLPVALAVSMCYFLFLLIKDPCEWRTFSACLMLTVLVRCPAVSLLCLWSCHRLF